MKNKPEVIFQNDTILALLKPPGLLSVPDRYNEEKPSLANLVLNEFPTARPLHRLDFETSGVLLFCIHPDAFGWYSDQFELRLIVKKYIAITEGRCMEPEGHIDAPLLTQNTGKVILSKRGKESQTSWRRIEGFQNHSFIEASPLTGRTHQIRVHLSSIGHPVVGDVTYGAKGPLYLSALKGKHKYRLSKNEEEERPLMARVALHAAALRFEDFKSRQQIEVEGVMPKDMEVTLTKLRQYASLHK